ncbi:pyridoxine 5'-phosphate oxidase C-terminal domain-containing protein, partial [Trebonia sp.]|uniref:pyridoxine 5'-phosphate oxidase C-terminal domain-containing protein n=1 Tax=Trebonia sp. TaxID=2767075 RepID=UPI003BB21E06
MLPSRVEFWQESPDGLRDRIRYRPAGRQRLDHRAAVAVTSGIAGSAPSARRGSHQVGEFGDGRYGQVPRLGGNAGPGDPGPWFQGPGDERR